MVSPVDEATAEERAEKRGPSGPAVPNARLHESVAVMAFASISRSLMTPIPTPDASETLARGEMARVRNARNPRAGAGVMDAEGGAAEGSAEGGARERHWGAPPLLEALPLPPAAHATPPTFTASVGL